MGNPKRTYSRPPTWEEYKRDQEEKRRQLRSSLVKLPTFNGTNSLKKYYATGDWEWEGTMRYNEGKRKAFSFEYEAVLPIGKVFRDRKAHYRISVTRHNGGLFSPDALTAWIHILAYPSSEYYQDGYGYQVFFSLENPGATLGNVLTFCDALISDLQYFINNPELGYDHSQKADNHAYQYKFHNDLSLRQVDGFFVFFDQRL